MSSNTNIGNTPVNQGYVQLIHMGETGGIDGTLRALYDGDGTASDLLIASNKVKIGTTLYIGSKTLTEFVQDTVGTMFSSNTETNITATYQDADGTIDLVSTGEVTLVGSQTLTNKTLTAPVLTGVTQGADITLSGDLTVNGTTITVDQTNLDVSDNIIGLNRGASSNANDSGLIIERGSTGDNAAIIWDESANKFTLGTTTSTPSATGDLTISTGTLVANIEGAVTGNASTATALASAGTLTFTGDVVGSSTPTYTGGGNLSIAMAIQANSIALGTDTTGNYVGTITGGTGITSTGATSGEGVAHSLSVDASQTQITAVGTIGTGVWNGTAIASAYLDADTAHLSGTQTFSGAKTFSSVSSITLGGHSFDDIDIGSEFVDTDDHIMSAGAIKEKIENYGYTTNVGDITGVDLTSGAGITISSETNTTSGAYSSTIATNIASTSLNVSGTGQLAINLNKSALSTATLNASDFMILFDANDSEAPKRFIAQDIFDSLGGITIDGTTANGLLTYGGTNNIDTESALTFDGSSLNVNGQLYGGFGSKTTGGTADWNHSTNARSGNGYTLLLNSATNGPTTASNATNSSYYHTLNFEYASYDGDANMTQLGIPYSFSTSLYGVRPVIRSRYGGTWSSWNSLITGNSAGQVLGAFGSAAAPSYSFATDATLDTDTGMYRAASDQLGFTAGGANKMTMTTTALDLGSGDFSIKKTGGNNTNNYAAVEVYSAGTAENQAAIAIQQQTSEGDTIIFADFEPHVEWGISADNSVDEIHFTGGSSTASLGTKTFKNNAGTNRTAYKKMSVGLNTGNVSIGGSVGIGTASPNRLLHLQSTGDAIMQITSADGSGAYIDLGDVSDVDGGRIVYDSGSNLLFNTASTEKVRITSAGNVGIGVSPSYKLDVAGDYRFKDTAAGGALLGYHNNDSDNGLLLVAYGSTYSGGSTLSVGANGTAYDHTHNVGIDAGASSFIALGVGGSEKMRVHTDGKVGIGTTSPSAKLDVVGDTEINGILYVSNSNDIPVRLSSTDAGFAISMADSNSASATHNRIGVTTNYMTFHTNNAEAMRIEADQDVHFDQDVIAFSTTPSDIRLKKNFTKIENGLDVVNKLEGHTFNWKKGGDRLSAGFKAQEVEKILPHLVDEKKLPLKADDDKEYKILRYEEMIPYLVEAIKEQQQQIDELRKGNFVIETGD